jgi:hypothetical protein
MTVFQNWKIMTLLVLCLLIIPSLFLERVSRKELEASASKYREVSLLSSEYRSLKEQVDAVEKKTALVQPSGIAHAVDTLVASLGIKDKMKSVKAVGGREIKGSLKEESAEVQIEKATLNELVNLFYRIGEGPMMLSLKRVTMKKSFENPELLDITMTVSLFTKK